MLKEREIAVKEGNVAKSVAAVPKAVPNPQQQRPLQQ